MRTRSDPIFGMMVLILLSPLVAGAEVTDQDGSRMRAPEVEVPSSHDDELSPPEDAEDWRYIVLEQPRELSVTLEAESEENRLRLRIDRASGHEVFSGETNSGAEAKRVTFEAELEPGIFYLRVTADEAASYRLRLE